MLTIRHYTRMNQGFFKRYFNQFNLTQCFQTLPFSTTQKKIFRLSEFEINDKLYFRECKKPLPYHCNMKTLSEIIGIPKEELKKHYRDIMHYEIVDELEYLKKDDLELFLLELNIEVKFESHETKLTTRPPIITIMGHVDHGKTTLLDTLRRSNMVEKEYGKITQSIGAFTFKTLNGQEITVIDTPGHEAFSKMRIRGAVVTDCVILVISCIEGVQKQTLEVLELIKYYNLNFVVALNKFDRIDDEMKKTVLLALEDNGVKVKERGGKVPAVFISAKKKFNIDLLQNEVINLTSKINLKEDTNINAQGFIIESKALEVESATKASLIVKKGILKVGDYFVCGEVMGKVKSMIDDEGNFKTEVTPGYAVEIVYLSNKRKVFQGSPSSGSLLVVMSKAEAQYIFEKKLSLKGKDFSKSKESIGKGIQIKLDSNFERHLLMKKGDLSLLEKKIEEHKFKETSISKDEISSIYLKSRDVPKTMMILADTEGILESIYDELIRVIGENLINKFLLLKKVGRLTEEEIRIANTANSLIFCFNVDVPFQLENFSNVQKIGIRSHKLIYDMVEEIKIFILEVALKINMPLDIIKGQAEVGKIFKIKYKSKMTNVAGIVVKAGSIYSSNKYRILRVDEVMQTELKLDSLKQNGEPKMVLTEGEEGGMIFSDYDSFKEKDIIEGYELSSPLIGISNTKRHVTCYQK